MLLRFIFPLPWADEFRNLRARFQAIWYMRNRLKIVIPWIAHHAFL